MCGDREISVAFLFHYIQSFGKNPNKNSLFRNIRSPRAGLVNDPAL